GKNETIYGETIQVPVSAAAMPSPQVLNLRTRAPERAGRYTLTVTLIDQPNATARYFIPSIDVQPTDSTRVSRGPVGNKATALATESPVPTLLQAILPSTRLFGATSIPYVLSWQVDGQPRRPLVAFINVYDSQSRYWSYPSGTETRFSADRTQPGPFVAESDSLALKPDMPPGHYWVEAGLLDPATNQRVPFVGPNGDPVSRVVVGSFWLLPPGVIPSGGTPGDTPDARVFGGQIALDSAQVVGTPTPGDQLAVNLRWSAREVPKADYTAFVHVVDASGKLIAQVDAQPTAGVYPTSAWQAGDTIIDTMVVKLPTDLPPGPYQVQLGLYDLKTMQRLAVTDANGAAQGDFVTLPP
ncbi:MAG TPA: hypothetical protein VFZ25_02990, partial [Chloroflexota bacterium]|nr:hypothetical protein [Chloroflexota bacterium]